MAFLVPWVQFLVVYKLGESHYVVDVLLRLLNSIKNKRVFDQILDATFSHYNLLGCKMCMSTCQPRAKKEISFESFSFHITS
jgi:hypothetical protein